MPDKVITKESIRKFRKEKGMSRKEFANFMGVSIHSIRSWEEINRKTNVPKRLLSDPRTQHLAEVSK
jgi:DNA-binding transcriptional regulator YiaG